MPYIIKEVKKGYKVCKKEEPDICFSNKPLSKTRAIKQRQAIGISSMKGGQNPDAELVKGLSGAVFDVAEMVPGFGTALSVVSPLIKTGLNALIDTLMYDPEIERRAQIKQDWADYIREVSLQKYGQELTPEEYRYVQYELKKRRKAKLAEERAQAIERDQKRAEEAGFKTIAEFSRAERVKGKQSILDKVREIGYNSVRDYQQARKRGDITAEQRKIVEGRGKPANKQLYQQVKDYIYSKMPKHSLYRSALVQKEYKKRGGLYVENGKKPMDIKKWFKQKWISLNDYVRGEIIPCGNSNTQKKYGEYPLCRPKSIADKLGMERIKLLIKEKTKLGKKPLITEKVLGTKEFNIKPTITGMGKDESRRLRSAPLHGDKFIKQLDEIGYPVEQYLKDAKKLAKESGYDPKKISLANNNDNKLQYQTPDGIKRFGKAGYGDFLIWSFKERRGEVPLGTADKKRNVFRKSHGAMTKKYNLGKFSPNELAINILW